MAGHIEISEICQKENDKSEIINNIDVSDKIQYGEEDGNMQQNSFCNITRYSRYDLLSLRNGQLSIHYPHCALRPDLQALSIWTCRLRCELQYLGLWKIPNTGNPYGNCNCNGSCQSYSCGDGQSYPVSSSQLNAVNSQICYGNVQQTQQLQPVQTNSSPTLSSRRAVRSRERSLNYQRCINTELIRATSPSGADGSMQHHLNHQVKPAFIDHRSISSSHLMPAFAKRRMSHANSLHGQSDSGSNFNNNSGHNTEHLSNDDESSECSTHFDTSLKSRKDSTNKSASSQNDFHMYKSSATNNRLDKGEQLLDSQYGWMNLIKNSPSNNKTNNAGSANKKVVYERRIGSGRLVPREVNWDMRTGNNKQNEKENSNHSNIGNNNNEKEKDNIIVGEVDKLNNRNSTSTARYPDARAQDRRSFDRRILNHDDSNNGGNSSTNKRYTTTSAGEERNNFDANYHGPMQHFSGQRSMSFRRREYVEHKDHHRDFRDFRDSKDARENRDHKEQRGSDHHNQHRDHKEEPEWFSEGPTSQHDTIELRGFEEPDESQQQQREQYSIIERKTSESSLLSHNSNTNVNSSTKENVDISNELSNNLQNHSSNAFDKDIDNGSINLHNNTAMPNSDTPITNESPIEPTQHTVSKAEDLENSDKSRTNVTELFFDNFLNIEALENTLIGSANDQSIPANNDVGGTSRFSRWFFNNSNNHTNDKSDNNPPTKDDTNKQANKDLNESDFNSFMTFLKCNKFPTPELPKGLPSNVSALSVEELEASMRKMDSAEIEKTKSGSTGQGLHKNDGIHNIRSEMENESESSPQSAEINSQDVEAFRKLLDQLGKPRVDISMNIILPNTPGQQHSLPNSFGGTYPPTGISPIPPNALPQPNMAKQEYMMKIMHQQQLLHLQQNVGKMVTPPVLQQHHHHHHRIAQMSPQQQTENLPLLSAPPPHHPHAHYMPIIMGPPQKRLDVQHLIQSVVREELSRSFLEKELKNPNVPPYTKDIISTVLKETSRYNLQSTAGSGQNATDSLEAGAANDISAAPNNLMQSLARGEVSLNLLEHELNKLNMNTANETTNSGAFNERSRCGTPLNSSLNVVSIPTSGGVVAPLPQQIVPAQKQNQVLTNDNVCPIMPDQQQAISSMLRSHHHEDPALHMPTHQELQMHTQAIMQNALFKKKLEVEQHEALRRRQEIHKQQEIESSNFSQQHQQSLNSNSIMPQQGHQQQQTRHVNSPTPLAFTPTSVLRKMTAEKDTISNSSQATTITSSSPQQIQPHLQQPHLKIHTHPQIHGQQMSYQLGNQPRMILGGGNFQYMHQQHQIAPAANGSPQMSPQQKSQIRNQPPGPLKWPIMAHSAVEANHSLHNNMPNKPMGRPILKGPGPIQPIVPQNAHNPHGNANQSSQPNQTVVSMQKYPSVQQPRQIVGQQFSSHIIQHIPTSQQNNMQQQLFQQRSVVMQRQQIQQNDLGNHAPLPPAHHPACNDNNSVTNLNFQREGGLSPTSNQLAQWFSPELLAQASAGKLPLLNMNQALSLEEFERSIQHSSTAVNN